MKLPDWMAWCDHRAIEEVERLRAQVQELQQVIGAQQRTMNAQGDTIWTVSQNWLAEKRRADLFERQLVRLRGGGGRMADTLKFVTFTLQVLDTDGRTYTAAVDQVEPPFLDLPLNSISTRLLIPLMAYILGQRQQVADAIDALPLPPDGRPS